MAFNDGTLINIKTDNSNAGRFWMYKENTTLSSMKADNYFNEAYPFWGVRNEDLILTIGVDGFGINSLAIDGEGDVTINETMESIPESIKEINVAQFGAVGDGSTDDTNAINNAVDAAKVLNTNVKFNKGIYAISESIDLIDAPGVKLIGEGGGFFADSDKDGVPSTIIKWIGASGTDPIIRIASTQSALTKATSGGVEGIALYCNGLAGKGLYITSVNSYMFRDITIDDPQTYGIHTDCLDNKLNNGGAGAAPADNQNNDFDQITVKSDDATCIFVSGNAGNDATLGANTSLNRFGQIQLNIRDNDGFVFEYSDGNTLEMLRVFRPIGNTGTGLIFSADDTAKARHARHNICYHVQSGVAGITAEAGTGAQPSDDNAIFGFSYGNGGLNNPPVIEAGATLSYISPRLIKNISGQIVAVSGLNDVAVAANAKTEIANLGTESLRVWNDGQAHVRMVTDTHTWFVRINNSNGNLELAPSTGAGIIGLLKKLTLQNQTTATSATAGVGTALPATPEGYLEIDINGTTQKIPYYNT